MTSESCAVCFKDRESGQRMAVLRCDGGRHVMCDAPCAEMILRHYAAHRSGPYWPPSGDETKPPCPICGSRGFTGAIVDTIDTITATVTATATGPRRCAVHGKKLSRFCVVDGVCVCTACLLQGPHVDKGVPHESRSIDDAQVRLRRSLGEVAAMCGTSAPQLRAAAAAIDEALATKAPQARRAAADRVNAAFDELAQAVETRRRTLLGQADALAAEREDALTRQAEALRAQADRVEAEGRLCAQVRDHPDAVHVC
jgi:hypothetical protein